MKLTELITDPKLAYHDELNPKLWVTEGDEDQLDQEVETHLILIARQFVESLKLPDAAIKDYVFTGSNANYNWTRYSDIDVHVMVDYDDIGCKDGACQLSAEDCLMAKKSLWNDRHDIQIKGHQVEVYASDVKHTLVEDAGCYSLLRREWIKKPQLKNVSIDSATIRAKADELAKEIDQIVGSKTTDVDTIQEIADRLWKYRQSGISRGGEFSVENLVFKALRNNGYVQKIRDYAVRATDRSLSLESRRWV